MEERAPIHRSVVIRPVPSEDLTKMSQNLADSTVSTNLVGRIFRPPASTEKDPQVLSTNAPSKSESLCAKQPNNHNGSEFEKRRPSLRVAIRESLFSSRVERQMQQDTDTTLEKSDEQPFNQQRRNSLREAIGSKLSLLTRRLSSQSISPKTESRRSSSISQSHVASALVNEYTELDRPAEWPDKTELDYLRRKNMAEAKRGVCYDEDDFERETREQTVAAKNGSNSSRSQSLPVRPAASAIGQGHLSRAKTAPKLVRLSKKPLSPPTRAQAFKAIRKAHLPRTPSDWSEFDVPEAEYFFLHSQKDTLDSALQQIINHDEKCCEMDGLCDHSYKSRESSARKTFEEIDHVVEGQWFNTMAEALADFDAEGCEK